MSTDPKPTEQAPIQAEIVTPQEDGHKVFVGNLSFKTKEEGLVSFFETSGKVLEAKIITLRPHYRKRSAGYGFVTFATLEETTKAAQDLNKKELDGREINVEVARPKPIIEETTAATTTATTTTTTTTTTDQEAKPTKQKKRRARKNKAKAKATAAAAEEEEASDDIKKTNEDENSKADNEETSTPSDTASETSSSRAPRHRKNKKNKKPAQPRRVKKELTEPSETSLFVGNLPYSSTDDTLKDVFKDLKVTSAHVARMRNGRSKGYGFVDLETHEEQTKALETIKDVQVEGRTLYLSVALSAPQQDEEPAKQEQEEKEQPVVETK
ncbi:hypothetical protein BC941DRAFT_171150 [Chlamydoabsidia padenii]|nr:hypothetical protein BC941DRAFT_171150 [Chlamydoabsidia padenii]